MNAMVETTERRLTITLTLVALTACGSSVTVQGGGETTAGGGGSATAVGGGGGSTGVGGAGGEGPAPLPNLCEDGSCVRVFLSSERYSADLGGVSGADAKCQALADAAAMEGEFKAWISSVDVSAAERLAHHQVPFVLVDGTTLAESWDALLVPELGARIALDEYGRAPASYDSVPHSSTDEGPLVWTGTGWDGSSQQQSHHCGGAHWQVGDGGTANAIVGFVYAHDTPSGGPIVDLLEEWTGEMILSSCAIEHHLYCFEQ